MQRALFPAIAPEHAVDVVVVERANRVRPRALSGGHEAGVLVVADKLIINSAGSYRKLRGLFAGELADGAG
jgi:hypothetical protein